MDPKNSAFTAGKLPGKPAVHTVPDSHFAFLPPCPPQLAAAVPRICTDKPADFDRAAFHRDFNASVIKFFRDQFTAGGETR